MTHPVICRLGGRFHNNEQKQQREILWRFAKGFFSELQLIAGHTDTTGNSSYLSFVGTSGRLWRVAKCFTEKISMFYCMHFISDYSVFSCFFVWSQKKQGELGISNTYCSAALKIRANFDGWFSCIIDLWNSFNPIQSSFQEKGK